MEKKITLTIASTAGDFIHEFAVNQPLHAVEREAMAHLKLDPSQADQFMLTLDGTTLDESKTLRELGLKDGDVLTLERREVVKV